MATFPPPTRGARGTGALAEESKPPFGKRKRKRKGRAQPFRKGKRSEEAMGPTLSAMLRGAPFGSENPMDAKRARQKKLTAAEKRKAKRNRRDTREDNRRG